MLTATFLLAVSRVGAQPPAVEKAFWNRFPGAEDPQWNEIDGVWEVDFTRNDLDLTARFAPNGTWLETQRDLDPDDLPAVLARFNRRCRMAVHYQRPKGADRYLLVGLEGREESWFDARGRPVQGP